MKNNFRQGLGLLSFLLLLAVSLLTAACGKSKSEQYADNQAKLRQMERTTDSLRYVNSQLTGQPQQQQQYAEQLPTPAGPGYYDNEQPTYSNGQGYNSQGYNNQGYNNSGHYSGNYDSDHRQEPYQQPSSQVGSHLAAAAVGAAVGGAAGYYAGNRRTQAAPAVTNSLPVTRLPSTPTPTASSPSRFRSSLTKTYGTSTPSAPRASIFSSSRPSPSASRTRSIFGSSSSRSSSRRRR